MARAISGSHHYVYILYLSDGLTPFYVGLGSNGRWEDHEKYARRGRRGYTYNVIRSLTRDGSPLIKRKVAEDLSREDAIYLEVSLIARYGRRPSGLLTNRTLGGDGGCDDPNVKARIALALTGRIRPEHEKLKISRTMRGLKKTQEHVAKVAAANTGKKRSEITTQLLRESHLGVRRSEAGAANHLAAVRLPAHRQRMSELGRGRRQSSDTISKRAEKLRKLVWITNGRQDKRIPVDLPIPDGWRRERSYRLPDETNLRRGEKISATKRGKRCQALQALQPVTSTQQASTLQLSLIF